METAEWLGGPFDGKEVTLHPYFQSEVYTVESGLIDPLTEPVIESEISLTKIFHKINRYKGKRMIMWDKYNWKPLNPHI